MTLLKNIKEYILDYAYSETKINNDKTLHEKYDEWNNNQYLNGRIYINEDPIDNFQLSFDGNCWIDTEGLEYSQNDYVIETSLDYGDLWDRMTWELDGEVITVTPVHDTNWHYINFGDLRENSSLILTVLNYTKNDKLYKGFRKEYYNKFVEY